MYMDCLYIQTNSFHYYMFHYTIHYSIIPYIIPYIVCSYIIPYIIHNNIPLHDPMVFVYSPMRSEAANYVDVVGFMPVVWRLYQAMMATGRGICLVFFVAAGFMGISQI